MKPLDVLRGFYARSPNFVREAVAPVISLVPTSMKFGKTYADWRARIVKARDDLDYANEQHLAMLRALVSKAHQGSPFYRTLINEAFGGRFDATTFTPEDLQRLPVLDKARLREAGDAVLAVPAWQVDLAETSGSNAEPPFAFYLDKGRSTREMAFVYDAWSRAGFSERHARASLRGFQIKEGFELYDWDPALRDLRLSVFPMDVGDVPAYLDQIDRRNCQFLYGYPSAIELLCRRMRQLDRVPLAGIKGILPISEPLYDHQRALIRSVLGDVQFSVFYGLSEKVAFAVEDSRQEGLYEFNPLYGVTELVDENDQPVAEPGREGRIVGTGFLSTGMPFIRYDTGDFAELVELPMAGNGHRLRVKSLAPRRKPGFLISAEGERVVTTDLTAEDPDLYTGIAEYQFYQDTPGKVAIRYIAAPGGTAADVEKLRSYVTNKSRGRLTFETEQVSQIAGGRGGKRAFIVQRLDMTLY